MAFRFLDYTGIRCFNIVLVLIAANTECTYAPSCTTASGAATAAVASTRAGTVVG